MNTRYYSVKSPDIRNVPTRFPINNNPINTFTKYLIIFLFFGTEIFSNSAAKNWSPSRGYNGNILNILICHERNQNQNKNNVTLLENSSDMGNFDGY